VRTFARRAHGGHDTGRPATHNRNIRLALEWDVPGFFTNSGSHLVSSLLELMINF